MELLLEILMGVLLDAAMLLLVLHLMKATNAERKHYCFLSGTFTAGFLCGIAASYLAGSGYIVLTLFAIGFMLSYTAFVFSFPVKRKHHEGH